MGTALALIVAVLVLANLSVWFPFTRSTADVHATSRKALFDHIWIQASGGATAPFSRTAGESRAIRAIRASCTAVLATPHRTVRLSILDDRLRARYDGLDGFVTTTDAFQDADVLAWMAAAGVDVSAPGTAEEAASLAALIRHAVLGQADVVGSGSPRDVFAAIASVRVRVDRYRWAAPWAFAVSVAILVGLWTYLCRSELRALTSRPSAPPTPASSSACTPPSHPPASAAPIREPSTPPRSS